MIAYCTNVHAGVTLDAVKANLEEHAVAVRETLGWANLPLGLWLAAPAAAQLAAHGCADFRRWLDERGLSVVTINGFPFGEFHGDVVKHRVYEPSWAMPERLDYTLNLARVLAELAPEGAAAGISTLPLGWRGDVDVAVAADQLRTLVNELARLERDTGRCIHVDLEPEPGCSLDRAEHVVAFFEQHLLPGADEARVRRFLRVCHDVCHSAVMFEEQADAIAQYHTAGIAVGKVQVSSAPCVNFEGMTSAQQCAARERLAAFAEPRYLHQTSVRRGGTTVFHEDLAVALDAEPTGGEWRVHFHVPIFYAGSDGLETTQDEIDACLRALGATDVVLEVETYAWTVLPPEQRTATLAEGIARELAWLAERVPAVPPRCG